MENSGDGPTSEWVGVDHVCFRSCGAKGIRTPDLFHAMEARYQLRHSPESCPRLSDALPCWQSGPSRLFQGRLHGLHGGVVVGGGEEPRFEG